MAEGGMVYPQVFVVDSQAACGPVSSGVPPRQGARGQKLLYLLQGLALLAIVIEACFIYHLYHRTVDPTVAMQQGGSNLPVRGDVSNEIQVGPTKNVVPAAFMRVSDPHTADDGVLLWREVQDESSFLYKLEYKDGRLTVMKEGHYYLYSKVHFTDFHCSVFKHLVVKHTPQYHKPIELMRAMRFHCPRSQSGTRNLSEQQAEMRNSFLGGVFHLYVGDSVYVRVENRTQLRQGSLDNFFGMFMI